MPNSNQIADPLPVVQNTTLEVQVAVLTEKVTQVIGNHEQRITALEARGKNWPTIVACFTGVAILILSVAGKVVWA